MLFSRWLEASEDDLEERIFAAVDNGAVAQGHFNTFLRQWVQGTNPALVGVRLPRTSGKPQTTTFLSGQYSRTLERISQHRIEEHGFSGIGLIVQPFTSDYLRTATLKHFDGIAIDNGMFTEAGRRNFSWDKYEKMVKVALAQEKREILREFHFFTIPDEPMNWTATMVKYQSYKAQVQRLRQIGAPAAICIQNGAVKNSVPYNEVDVIFIGGDDKWKTGPEAQEIVEESQRRGKNVHMGRVNNLKRLNIASHWQVNTADGTYLMHELAKALHEIERGNPRRSKEDNLRHAERLRRILHGEHEPGDVDDRAARYYTEPDIVGDFVTHVLDSQRNNMAARRYEAIADLVRRSRRTVDKRALAELGRFLPAVPHLEPDEDVVEFDAAGNIRLDGMGRPVRDMDVFDRLTGQLPYRPLPQGIPFDPKDYRVYTGYINRYIARMRQLGVMPR